MRTHLLKEIQAFASCLSTVTQVPRKASVWTLENADVGMTQEAARSQTGPNRSPRRSCINLCCMNFPKRNALTDGAGDFENFVLDLFGIFWLLLLLKMQAFCLIRRVWAALCPC